MLVFILISLVVLLLSLVSALLAWVLIPRYGGTPLHRLTGSGVAFVAVCGLLITTVSVVGSYAT